MSGVRFDHVSFGVADAKVELQKLRTAYGAIPLTGEQSSEFRYVISHVGTVPGLHVELLDAKNRPDGFLQRFLDRKGEGPHHITFEVDDIAVHIDRLAEVGVPVTQVSTDYPPWQEAFIHPDEAPGILIQICATTCHYPSIPELLTDSVTIEPEQMPHTLDGADRRWWFSEERRGAPLEGHVRGVSLTVQNLGRAEEIFAKALGAQVNYTGADGVIRYDWQGRFVEVRPGDEAGLDTVYVRTAVYRPLEIAGIPFLPDPDLTDCSPG